MRSRKTDGGGDSTAENIGRNYNKSSKRYKQSVYSIPFFFGVIFIAFLSGLYGLVYFINEQLPTPLTIMDEKLYPDAFIAERARLDLKALTDLGPRVVGSYENEVLAVAYLKKEITNIINQAHRNQKIEMDIQLVTGVYYLASVPVGSINAYSNIQNVVVKLYAKNESNNSLLLNVHFDSVPTSPGGSDDGINCAASLEILRKFSRKPERPSNNIIFLFNGAEETSLQAAHGFISQHKWAEECKVVVNLDAAGAGGKIVLFQTGPSRPWLTETYAKVPHPAGQASGEEIFQSNLIPSDTDFRIFRDFGKTVGVDMAFVKNGYRYHTKYDGFENIPLGSIQQVGDNVMSLLNNILEGSDLSNEHPREGNVIFFDFLGGFFLTYSINTAFVINLIAVLISIAMFCVSLLDFKIGMNMNIVVYFLKIKSAVLFGWIWAAMCVVVVALTLDGLSFSMSWYANPWLLFGLYVVPTIIASAVPLLFAIPENLSPNVNCQIQAHIVRLVWTFIMFAMTLMGIRTSYVLLITVLFNSIAFIIVHALRLQHSIWLWKVIYIAISIIPTMFVMYGALLTLTLFIPITGRIGSNKNPDIIIGFTSFVFTVITISPFLSFIVLLRQPWNFIKSLAAIFAIFFVIAFTPLGFPYTGNYDSPAPERFWILHSRRVFHGEEGTVIKQDAGYLMLNMDRNSPRIIVKHVKEMNRVVSLEEDCKNFLLCGLPLAHPKMVQIVEHSSWIPASQPIVQEPVQLEVNSKINISPTIIQYNITVSGPDRTSIYLSPKKNMNLLNTSLLDHLPANTAKWNDRPYYFFVHISGKAVAPLTLTFDIEVPPDYSGTTMDIAIAGKYLHEKRNVKTPSYQEFLSQFPDWADLTAWLASYEAWII